MENFQVRDLVPEIARHLDGFTPLVRWGTSYLSGPDDAYLAVHALMGRTEWVVVTGLYPTECPDLRRHSIVVTAGRGPEHIAKKITRRLLPKYLRDLERYRARAARYAERAGLVDALADVLPDAKVTEAEQQAAVRWRLGSMYGVFEVRDQATSIEIRDADRELAERVAYAISERAR